MNRDNFFKIWSLEVVFDPFLESFPESIEKTFFTITKDDISILRLTLHNGITLVSIDDFFGIKIDLDINDLEEGDHIWTLNVIQQDNVILFDSGTINALGKRKKKKVARPWDLLNPKTEYVDVKVSDERLELCKSCEMFTKGLCKSCGCYMPIKVKLSHASCPLHKWGELHD